MSLVQLIIKGRVDGGRLEKFADGCNSMARSFWLGRHVELLKEGKDYTLKTSGNGRTVTSDWVDLASCSFEIYPIGPFIASIIMLAYALACIPVAITMGVGLVAKKIALATDENSNRYQAIAQKYLVLAEQDKELKQLNDILKSKIEIFNFSEKELQFLEDVEISGYKEHSFNDVLDGIVKGKKKSTRGRIESTRSEIEIFNKNIESTTVNFNKLKSELEHLLKIYIDNKNEQFNAINL